MKTSEEEEGAEEERIKGKSEGLTGLRGRQSVGGDERRVRASGEDSSTNVSAVSFDIRR